MSDRTVAEFKVTVTEDGGVTFTNSSGVVFVGDASSKWYNIDYATIVPILIKLVGVVMANSSTIGTYLTGMRGDGQIKKDGLRSPYETPSVEITADYIAKFIVEQEAVANGELPAASATGNYVADSAWAEMVANELPERIDDHRRKFQTRRNR